MAAAAPTPVMAAASGLYDMDRFLSEPYPFATTAQPVPVPAPAPAVIPAPAPAQRAAATVPEEDANDPLEPMNRAIFAFNEFFIDWVLGPLVTGYRFITPDLVEDGIGNILDNLASPTILMNDLLQGEFGRAWKTTQRVAINTTVGVAGLFDVAEFMGIGKHDEDMGQTLAVWGVGEGAYLVIPFLGPSNPRDAFGKVFDTFTHPLTLWAMNADRDEINYAIAGVKAIHGYSLVQDDLENMRETSVDFYATLRSAYRQQRESAISNSEFVVAPGLE